MKFVKILTVTLSIVLCLGMFAGCGGEVNYAANNTEFIIGVSGPLTGGAAMYGNAVVNSAQMAVDEINAAGGLNGVMFKLVSMDDMNDATKISTNYSSMYEALSLRICLQMIMCSSSPPLLPATIFLLIPTDIRCALQTVTRVKLQQNL